MIKKVNHLTAMFGAAAVLSLSTSIHVFAFAGWVENNGDWYYTENGDEVKDAWKTAANGQQYYLGNTGKMLRSTLVDGMYYVDSHGMQVSDQWRKLSAISGSVAKRWFYFGNDGKMVKGEKILTIHGKQYKFDKDGQMVYGWDDEYYYGTEDEGAKVSKDWRKIPDEEGSGDLFWFYFGEDGKKYTGYRQNRKIANKRYAFDEEGRMLSGWISVESGNTDNPESFTGEISAADSTILYAGVKDDGAVRTSTWQKAYAPSDEEQDTLFWYYFQSTSYPVIGQETADTRTITNINGKYYAFSTRAEMLDGLQVLDGKQYYFGKDGVMRVGKQTVRNDEDELQEMYFQSDQSVAKGKGRGLTGAQSGWLYVDGERIKATEDEKYAVVNISEVFTDKLYLVNSKGTIQKNKTVKNSSGYLLTTDKEGNVIKIVLDEKNAVPVFDYTGEGFSAELREEMLNQLTGMVEQIVEHDVYLPPSNQVSKDVSSLKVSLEEAKKKLAQAQSYYVDYPARIEQLYTIINEQLAGAYEAKVNELLLIIQDTDEQRIALDLAYQTELDEYLRIVENYRELLEQLAEGEGKKGYDSAMAAKEDTEALKIEADKQKREAELALQYLEKDLLEAKKEFGSGDYDKNFFNTQKINLNVIDESIQTMLNDIHVVQKLADDERWNTTPQLYEKEIKDILKQATAILAEAEELNSGISVNLDSLEDKVNQKITTLDEMLAKVTEFAQTGLTECEEAVQSAKSLLDQVKVSVENLAYWVEKIEL
ncbi:hypothetical protein FACS189418_0240 [Clostridia bacterium]|nr:hypothetical protein FACS189418_0240 [Clostridia bacterium]